VVIKIMKMNENELKRVWCGRFFSDLFYLFLKCHKIIKRAFEK
jgi:hypothetical protein